MFFCPVVPFVPDTKMIGTLEQLGLLAGLKLCLDAGDVASVAVGSQTKWLDVAGGGYDFFRGTTAASQATDPTFNGAAGGQSASEYWSLDGGDFFTYDTTNETWMQNIHKNNAVFAFAMWVYLPDVNVADGQCMVGDNNASASGVGFNVSIPLSGVLRVGVTNGTGANARVMDSAGAVTASQWEFLAGTFDEAAGTGTVQISATQTAVTSTYPAPSASSATNTLAIAADGFGDAQLSPGPGTRYASVCFWEGTAPSAAALLSLYNATKAKFGL